MYCVYRGINGGENNDPWFIRLKRYIYRYVCELLHRFFDVSWTKGEMIDSRLGHHQIWEYTVVDLCKPWEYISSVPIFYRP